MIAPTAAFKLKALKAFSKDFKWNTFTVFYFLVLFFPTKIVVSSLRRSLIRQFLFALLVLYFVLFYFISHPSPVRISKVLCAFSWIRNDSWTLYLKCTFFFFFSSVIAHYLIFEWNWIEKRNSKYTFNCDIKNVQIFAIKQAVDWNRTNDFWWYWMYFVKWRQMDQYNFQPTCRSLQLQPCVCVCWIYCYALSVVQFLFCSAKWRWKLQFSRRINLLRFYLHA